MNSGSSAESVGRKPSIGRPSVPGGDGPTGRAVELPRLPVDVEGRRKAPGLRPVACPSRRPPTTTLENRPPLAGRGRFPTGAWKTARLWRAAGRFSTVPQPRRRRATWGFRGARRRRLRARRRQAETAVLRRRELPFGSSRIWWPERSARIAGLTSVFSVTYAVPCSGVHPQILRRRRT